MNSFASPFSLSKWKQRTFTCLQREVSGEQNFKKQKPPKTTKQETQIVLYIQNKIIGAICKDDVEIPKLVFQPRVYQT